MFGSLLIFAWVRIWVDEGQRHSLFNRELKSDVAEMRRLGINIQEVEAEYIKMTKAKKDPRSGEVI